MRMLRSFEEWTRATVVVVDDPIEPMLRVYTADGNSEAMIVPCPPQNGTPAVQLMAILQSLPADIAKSVHVVQTREPEYRREPMRFA